MYNRQYYLDNKEKFAEQSRKWNRLHKEEISRYHREYYLIKKEQIRLSGKVTKRDTICTACEKILDRKNFNRRAICQGCRAEQKRVYSKLHKRKSKPTDHSAFWEEARKRACTNQTKNSTANTVKSYNGVLKTLKSPRATNVVAR